MIKVRIEGVDTVVLGCDEHNVVELPVEVKTGQEQGLRVPQDVSVLGFDDIPGAAFHTPSVTTVRQPLERMGEVAAQCLLDRIEGKNEYPPEIAIEPELVVRESTAKASGSR